MEILQVLEQRITQLVELVKKLQEENVRLTKEHVEALEKIENLENSMLKDNSDLEMLNNERKKTMHRVDELIKNINLLVDEEQQP